ncbi:hypothetical protein AgCh_022991 [Apium graveolens]
MVNADLSGGKATTAVVAMAMSTEKGVIKEERNEIKGETERERLGRERWGGGCCRRLQLHFGREFINNKPWHMFNIASGKIGADCSEETEQNRSFFQKGSERPLSIAERPRRTLSARSGKLSGRAGS